MEKTSLPYCMDINDVKRTFSTTEKGLTSLEASKRLAEIGPNVFPRKKPPSLITVFFRQFFNPIIYILLFAGLVSLIAQHFYDALFILAVLLANSTVGTVQEYFAEKSAEALKKMVKTKACVLRDGEEKVIDAEGLVPGDVVILKPGSKVPADLRLIWAKGLTVNESLLTGESESVLKDFQKTLEEDTSLGDRVNMAYAATLVTRGFGRGVVIATGLSSQVGQLSEFIEVVGFESETPLIIRMKNFTKWIALGLLGAVAAIFLIEILRGASLIDVFILSVALAVSAIPGGLPIALTIALSIATRRMARRNVIVRRLVAVETLGSCSYIAADKTGTLTLNELTVKEICFPEEKSWKVTGEGCDPQGEIYSSKGDEAAVVVQSSSFLNHLAIAAISCNEAIFQKRGDEWEMEGDMVDIALLIMAHKAGCDIERVRDSYSRIAAIPYESEHQFAASAHKMESGDTVFVKGAVEKILPMCSKQITREGDKPLEYEAIEKQANEMAKRGYRVLAFASGAFEGEEDGEIAKEIKGLTFLGLVGMVDPLRPESKDAVKECQSAGIVVTMLTGDHPETALSIARELNLAEDMKQVMTGKALKELEKSGEKTFDQVIAGVRVFARIDPKQKVQIIEALKRLGHFVAVTGDGANDAPSLSRANVGVAMGKRGADIAKESAELLITDDNFASIAAGVEEGRVVYSNIRNVIFLLISTGAAEVVVFILALIFDLPLPLLATQLLWLNVITNGIQDVALAFEPAEGDEMNRPPRSPKERVFNRIMIKRILLSGSFMGVLAFFVFRQLWAWGWDLVSTRNMTLLLLVLFENVHVFNSRSENRSAFFHNPLKNPFLFFGVIIAQLIHIGAMYTPGLRKVLQIHPVSLHQWLLLLGLVLTLLVLMEGEKLVRKRRRAKENIFKI